MIHVTLLAQLAELNLFTQRLVKVFSVYFKFIFSLFFPILAEEKSSPAMPSEDAWSSDQINYFLQRLLSLTAGESINFVRKNRAGFCEWRKDFDQIYWFI